MATEPPTGAPPPFRILYVCRENLIRSPMAEELTRQLLQRRFGSEALDCVALASAGTRAIGNRRFHQAARSVMDERGFVLPGRAASPLTPEVVLEADLVLTATRDQRSEVVRSVPSSVRKVFTMVQFARLCDAGAAAATEGWRPRNGTELVRLAEVGRTTTPSSPAADDIHDPEVTDPESMRICMESIMQTIEAAIAHLECCGEAATEEPGASEQATHSSAEEDRPVPRADRRKDPLSEDPREDIPESIG